MGLHLKPGYVCGYELTSTTRIRGVAGTCMILKMFVTEIVQRVLFPSKSIDILPPKGVEYPLAQSFD
jgi:hypothetical protein